MFEPYTDRARKVLQLANQEAQRLNHKYIGTEHILLGLVKEGSGVASVALRNLDIDLRAIRMEVEKLVQSEPDMVQTGKLPQTPRAKKAIEYSLEEARNLNHKYVGTEHLLLGLLREQDGVAAQVLVNLGLKLDDVRNEVEWILGKNRMADDMASDKTGKPDARQDPHAELQGLPAETLKIVMELDAQIEQLTKDKEAAVAQMDFEKAADLLDKAHRLKKQRADLIRRGQSRASE
jgi:ATP-dependent Clp protease ATP-binding subunit ClpC